MRAGASPRRRAAHARLSIGALMLLAGCASASMSVPSFPVVPGVQAIDLTWQPRAGMRLGEDRYVNAAARAARFVLDHLGGSTAKSLLHVYREGAARVSAFLDDYAFLIQGLLSLAAATKDDGWTKEALRLQAEQDERLLDPKEIADFVAFIVSPLASGVNGAALRVDGGIVRSVF